MSIVDLRPIEPFELFHSDTELLLLTYSGPPCGAVAGPEIWDKGYRNLQTAEWERRAGHFLRRRWPASIWSYLFWFSISIIIPTAGQDAPGDCVVTRRSEWEGALLSSVNLPVLDRGHFSHLCHVQFRAHYTPLKNLRQHRVDYWSFFLELDIKIPIFVVYERYLRNWSNCHVHSSFMHKSLMMHPVKGLRYVHEDYCANFSCFERRIDYVDHPGICSVVPNWFLNLNWKSWMMPYFPSMGFVWSVFSSAVRGCGIVSLQKAVILPGLGISVISVSFHAIEKNIFAGIPLKRMVMNPINLGRGQFTDHYGCYEIFCFPFPQCLVGW